MHFSFCSFQFIGPFPKKLAPKKGLQGPLWPSRKIFWLKHCIQYGSYSSTQSDMEDIGQYLTGYQSTADNFLGPENTNCMIFSIC